MNEKKSIVFVLKSSSQEQAWKSRYKISMMLNGNINIY